MNFSERFYDFLKGEETYLKLESNIDYVIEILKSVEVKSRKIVYSDPERATLLIGIENYDSSANTQDGHLITLANGAEVLFENINFTQPAQLYNTQPWGPSLFRSVQNPKVKWTAIIKNSNNGEEGGFGVGFIYGGIYENNIALINVNFIGSGLMDAKNPYNGGVLRVSLDNVNADYSKPERYGDNKILTKGIFRNGQFKCTGDFNFKFLDNHYFRTDIQSNSSFLVHAGRFTHQIDRLSSLEDWSTCNLRPAPKKGDNVVFNQGRAFFINKEPQAGDTFIVNGKNYYIVEKNRTYVTDWTAWGDDKNQFLAYQVACFTEGKTLENGEYPIEMYNSTFNLWNDEVKVYLIFKQNYDFRSHETTVFGDREILSGAIIGHLCYNHNVITLWAKDSSLLGYYRQTQGNGICLGYNMVNCSGFSPEFNPPVQVTQDLNLPMPKEIIDLLNVKK